MYKRLDRAHRAMSLVLGMLALVSLGVLLAWNINPKFFPIRAHGFLAAFPLAMIAIAYLLNQSARRPSAKEFLKAMMLAVAFLFWAAINSGQIYPKRLSSTTLPLRSSSSMYFWS
jgi:cytochrome c oxidase assembly factor CtaG